MLNDLGVLLFAKPEIVVHTDVCVDPVRNGLFASDRRLWTRIHVSRNLCRKNRFVHFFWFHVSVLRVTGDWVRRRRQLERVGYTSGSQATAKAGRRPGYCVGRGTMAKEIE